MFIFYTIQLNAINLFYILSQLTLSLFWLKKN